jgi:hypothetical protein
MSIPRGRGTHRSEDLHLHHRYEVETVGERNSCTTAYDVISRRGLILGGVLMMFLHRCGGSGKISTAAVALHSTGPLKSHYAISSAVR